MQSGGQSAGIQLQVGLDLAFFRSQLPKLGTAAASYPLTFNIEFNRKSIQNELNALGANIKQRTYRLEVKTNLGTEIDNAKKLADALVRLQQVAQGAKGVFPVGTKALGLKKGPGQPGANEIKSLYEALAIAGAEGFEQGSKKNRAQMVTQIGTVAKDTVAGLLNGLKSQDARVQAAAKSLGASLIASMKAVLGIASPSKEFEKIGKNVGEGFEKGALSSMDKAFDALERQLQSRLRKLQGMMQPSASRRGAFPFIAKTGAIESQALMSESIALAQQLDQARAQIAQIQQRKEGRLSFERASLSESAGRMLPAGRSAVPMVSAQELVAKSFYVNMRNGSRMLRENFSANSYFPKATKALASAMDDATSGIKALPGARGPIAALPSTEMLDKRKFQSAMEKAAQIDAQNIALQQTARANATMQMRQQLSALPPISAPSIGSTNAPLSRAATYSLNKANQLLGLPIGPSSPLGSMGRFPMSGMAGRGSMGQFPVDPMLAVGGASAMGQKIAGPYPFSNTARSARGGYFPGISSSLFFPMSGMMGPSSPLGSITPQSSMFGAGGPPGGPPRPPSGSGGGMGGMGGISRALGGVNLPGAGMVREIGEEFGMATKQVLLFGTAYKGLAFLTSFPAQVQQAVSSLQSFRNTLKEITPSAQEFDSSNRFILSLVDQYNIPLQSAREGFTKLYASMAPAGFSGQEIRGLFEGISVGAATFGMSADKVDRVMYAFAQMASKGQVMSEELKGQLGDVLPGALALFARAANMSLTDFGKAMEDGAFKGDAMRQLLINVGATMKEEFGKGAVGAALTFQGVMNRLQTTVTVFYETFEPVAVAFSNAFVLPLTNGIRVVTDAFKQLTTGQTATTQLGAELASKIQPLIPIFEGIGNNIKMTVAAVVNFAKALMPVIQLLLQLASTPIVGVLAQVYATVLLLNGAFTLLGGRILMGLIGSMAQTIGQMTALNAASIATNSSLAGTQLQLRLLAGGLATTGGAVTAFAATMRTAMMTTVVGAIATAVAFGISEFMRLRGVMDSVAGRYKSIGDQARMMGESGNVSGVQRLNKNLLEQANTYEKIAKGLNTAQRAGGMLKIDKATQALLKRAGLEGYDAGTGILTAADANNIKAAINANRQETKNTMRVLSDQEKKAKAEAAKLDATLKKQPLPPGSGGDSDAATDKAAKEAARLASQQQQNSIDAANRQNALNQAITEGLMALDDQAFQHRLSLIDARNNYELAGLNSIEARQEKFQQDLQKIELDRINTVRKAQQEVQKASLQYAAAQNTAAASQGSPAVTGQIDKSVLRDWLVSQGFGRTTGDFTNKGHATPNHMLNAMDMGILGGSDADALRKTADMEKRLRATGAFGSQLFGPTSDPYGHGAGKGGQNIHLHIPTPGGKVNMTSGLASLMGQSGATNTMQRREDKAGGKLVAEQQQLSNQQIEAGIVAANAANEALAQRKSLIASNINTIFPVAEQRLENDLMKIRNQLQLQGMPQEYIDYQESTYKGSYESAQAIAKLKEETVDYSSKRDALQAKQAKGIALTQQESIDLKVYTEAVKQNDDAVVELTDKQKQYQIVQLEGALAAMKNADALKAQQETMSLIKGSVESASSSYKGFMKEVAMGGDPSEALKKFQEAITDQVLTVFFDFAMKPVEDFFKNQLSAMFGIETEESAREKAIAKMEEQLKEARRIAEATEQTARNTGAPAPGTSATSAAPSFTPEGALPESFNAASVFASTGSGTAAGTPDAASAVGAWGDSLNTQLSKSLTEATKTADTEGKTLGDSLSKAVGAVGMAAGAAMGIVAGISQIKEGGTSNVLGGIGSVLMSLGGAVGGFAGFFKGANGGVAGGGWKPFPVTAFANGGMVNGPTLGLVGEGKYNEAIVPLPDGRSIPVQMKGGSGLREAMSGNNGRASGSPILNMSFQSTNINGVEYVSRDQLEQAMAATRRQAASDGAKRGMSMTLDKLQQSPSTRSRLGMGGR